MAAKIDPRDWDRLFDPNAPRRGGPLRAALNVTLVIVALAIIGAMAVFAIETRARQTAATIERATTIAQTVIPQQTATAEAAAQATATGIEAATATALARPTPAPSLGIGAVNQGGNLRSEPIIAPETVIGLIWPGDQVEFLAQRDLDGQLWYFIRITEPSPARGGEGVPAGTEGWASASLLSPIAPLP